MRQHRYHPWRALALGAVLMFPHALGCKPIECINTSSKAGAALAAAKQVGAERLASCQYTAASQQPIETNKTAAGQERNRRVELTITQQWEWM